MTRRDASDSESNASRSSSDSEQNSECSEEEMSKIDAAGQSDKSGRYDHDDMEDGARAQSARAGKTVSSPVDDPAGFDSYQDQGTLSRLSSTCRADSRQVTEQGQ
jgi:hypothetical protein